MEKGPMNTKHRKNIVREAKRLIGIDIKDYFERQLGEREVILDSYIEKVCNERGWSFSHFYAEDGKLLEKILNP